MRRPRLLDLFCGAGGAAVGYDRAGFDVVGVDIVEQPRYPYEFHRGDATTWPLGDFDVIHASPPCPRYSTITPRRADHPDLLTPTRERLLQARRPYVLENVPGAPLRNPVLMCGAAYGLGARCVDGRRRPLRRHRLFESNLWLMSPGCACDGREPIGVYGIGGGGYYPSPMLTRGGGYKAHPDEARAALGVDWMRTRRELSDAIPPIYTEHIGGQLLERLGLLAAS